MEEKKIIFNARAGAFIDSVRAYKKHKKEWQERMQLKLAKMEEEIRKAKEDPFYKVETI